MVQSDWYWASAIFFTFMSAALAVAWHGDMLGDESKTEAENEALKKRASRVSYDAKNNVKRVEVSNDPKFLQAQGRAVDTAGGLGETAGAGLS